MKRLAIHVTGKVQGVHYRQNTATTAQRIGLTGYVRNEADGSVYIEAQGTEAQLQQLVDWCHRGPLLAQVKEVRTEEIGPGREKDFKVQRD